MLRILATLSAAVIFTASAIKVDSKECNTTYDAFEKCRNEFSTYDLSNSLYRACIDKAYDEEEEACEGDWKCERRVMKRMLQTYKDYKCIKKNTCKCDIVAEPTDW